MINPELAQNSLELTGNPMVDDLRAWANEYALESGGLMRVLAHEPDTYPGQTGVSAKGSPNDLAVISMFAHTAQPKYTEVLAQLEHQAESSERIDVIGEHLAAGGNVELITNHGDLIDVAVAHAALYTVLHKRGYEQIKTGIIISKMIAYLEHKFGDEYMPCVSVLQLLENDTFLSYPRTPSAQAHMSHADSLRNKGHIKTHNLLMRQKIERRLGKGGLLLAMAASGSTDKPLSYDRHTISLGRVGQGTVKLMQQPRTLVAPMAVWYKGEEPVMEIAETPRLIGSDAEAHGVMYDIAAALTVRVPGKAFNYQTN